MIDLIFLIAVCSNLSFRDIRAFSISSGFITFIKSFEPHLKFVIVFANILLLSSQSLGIVSSTSDLIFAFSQE